uniref:Uncharacterized protein n=1 Tax=Arundo donax TaxID=35708 RepID=A0A0A9BB61_ARUDO
MKLAAFSVFSFIYSQVIQETKALVAT